MTKTTTCHCLACDPKSGEIGLECRKSQTTPMKTAYLNSELEGDGAQTTKFAHRKQTMKFEIELNGIGWDFSLGMIIDELRKAVEPAFPHIVSRSKVSVLQVALEDE